jgi:hypothetical protein
MHCGDDLPLTLDDLRTRATITVPQAAAFPGSRSTSPTSALEVENWCASRSGGVG